MRRVYARRVAVPPLAVALTAQANPDAVAFRRGDPRTMPLLVVYASRHGATAEIAAPIATRLVDSGASVDLRPVDEVETLDGYDAVVLGAPVYDQSWPPEANAFVAENRDALAARPLWLFSVGAFGDTKHLIGPLTRKSPGGSRRSVPGSTRASIASSKASSTSTSGRSGRACSSTPLAAASATTATGRRSTRGPTGSRSHSRARIRRRRSNAATSATRQRRDEAGRLEHHSRTQWRSPGRYHLSRPG
jgi:hypothetical protein